MASLLETLREAPLLPEGSDERKLKNRLAMAMLQEGSQTGPIQHWSQGTARLMNALMGGYMAGQQQRAAGREEKAEAESVFDLPGMTPSGGNVLPGTLPGPTAAGASGDPMASYDYAIGKGESGNRYDAVGPETGKGRAYGKHQVMDFNIGPWTKEVIGRELTPDEFLNNPPVQDAVFKTKFGQYVDKYGNPQDAASAWFTGRPLSEGAGRRDVTGTTGRQYVNNFNAALGGVPGQPPAMRGGMPQPGQGMPGGVPGVSTALFGGPQGAPQGIPPQGMPPGAPQGVPQGAPPGMPPQGGPQPGTRPVMQASLGGPAGMPPQGVPGGAPAGLPPPGAPQAQPGPQLAQAGPQIPPQIQQAIQRLWANPRTRPQAQQLYLQYAKPPPAPPSAIQEYEYAKRQGFQGSMVDYQLAKRKAGATNVTTNVGGGDKFFEELDKSNAKMFGDLQNQGVQASQSLIRINRLDDLLSKIPTGTAASFKQIAGNYGIKTEGLDDIQAAQALINQLVPQQRPPGSGPMSDADLELFKQSMPRIINQPGGNRLIIETARGINQYTIQQSAIADQVANREITPIEGRRKLRELKNPLAGFSARTEALSGSKPAQGAPQPGTVEDGYRFKGGNPADRNSWERIQ